MDDRGRYTVRDALGKGAGALSRSESPRLDASLLLAHVLNCSREKILASLPDELSAEKQKAFKVLIEKRAAGFPVAWIVGKKEFYGRDFILQEGILCPRPDTEILVEEALKAIRLKGYKRVHDLCTGSGCIALTLALETPCPNREFFITASDISPVSRELFEKNRQALNIENTTFTLGAGLAGAGLNEKVDLIVSNPPYLTSQETRERMEAGWKEPEEALDGGEDGLELVREIISQSPAWLKAGGMLILEADPRQMESIALLMAQQHFQDIRCTKDLAGDERVIQGVLP